MQGQWRLDFRSHPSNFSPQKEDLMLEDKTRFSIFLCVFKRQKSLILTNLPFERRAKNCMCKKLSLFSPFFLPLLHPPFFPLLFIINTLSGSIFWDVPPAFVTPPNRGIQYPGFPKPQ